MTDGNDLLFSTKTVTRHETEQGVQIHVMDVPSGLTKREFFAAMIAAGHTSGAFDPDFVLKCTDALIEALNK